MQHIKHQGHKAAIRRVTITAFVAFVSLVLISAEAHAEIVFFSSGRTLSVKGHRAEGDSIVQSREKLLTLIDELVGRYPTAEGKIVVAGFSQGGMMAIDVGFRTKQKVAGIICMSGAIYEGDAPPLRKLPVLLIHGTEDEMIPLFAAQRTRMVLEENGVAPEYHEFPMGHQVTEESMVVVRTFLQRVFA